MDPIRNPFFPGAGTPPHTLEGRQEILKKTQITLARTRQGKPSKSFLLIGLRGVGKTVLLNKIRAMAEDEGYKTGYIEVHENKTLAELMVPSIKKILFSLDRAEKMNEQVKRAFRVLKSFVGGVKVTIQDVEYGLSFPEESGVADSGDLEFDLPELLLAVATAAQSKNTAIAFIIDELQYLSEKELSALIMGIHRVTQNKLPLVLVGAGLPQLVGLCGSSKSYAERLFDFPEIGALNDEDARNALQDPVKDEGAAFEEKALSRIVSLTQGYPYFLQEWGHYCWDIATESPITNSDVDHATRKAIENLDQSFFRVRFDRLTPREKQYLRAMAELGANPQRSGDIAAILGVKVQSIAPVRSSLIKKGMIYSPHHGDTAFTVPLFDQFMKRIIPKMKNT